KRFPKVISFNNTYNTNRFKLFFFFKLLTFSFINNEKLKSFRFFFISIY
ncbi:uncharacterized protein CLUP02_07395, partial [Colletotrichum lupini]